MGTIKAGTYRFNDVLERIKVVQLLNFYVPYSFELNDDGSAVTRLDTPVYYLAFNWKSIDVLQYHAEDSTANVWVYGGSEEDGWSWDIMWSLVSDAMQSDAPDWLKGYGQTIVIPEDAEVSDEFVTWFASNTTSVTVLPEDKTNIVYDGKCIASLEAGQTATLPCEGKKMATDIAVIAPKSGGEYSEGGLNIVPLIVGENGTFDENGPVIVTETFTGGGTPDATANYWGYTLPYFKAKKLIATNDVIGAIKNGQVSFRTGDDSFPIESDDSALWIGTTIITFSVDGAPAIVWVITPNEYDFTEAAGFEPNSVYILDVWSMGLLAEGVTASLTAPGRPDKPIDGYMPVKVELPIEDELKVTPKLLDIQTFEGKYYRKITVDSVPTTTLTVKPSMEKQTFSAYNNPNRETFGSVTVEAFDLSTTSLLCDIEMETLPTKIEYETYEHLDTSGGVLLRKFTNGDIRRVNLVNGYVYGFHKNFGTPGAHTAIVQYTENGITCRTSYDFHIKEPTGTLSAPTLSRTGDRLDVDCETSYQVLANGEVLTYMTSGPWVYLSEYSLPSGTYSFTVRAVSQGCWASAESNAVEYTIP